MYEDLTAELRIFETVCKHSDKPDIADLARRAADAIEELQGRAKVLEKVADKWCEAVPKWIPVTERLPENPENYPNCKLREYYFLVTLETNAVVCREYDFDNKRWPGTIRVTHWMLLPEPPKGAK